VQLQLHLLLKHRIIQLSRQRRQLIHMLQQAQILTQPIHMAPTHTPQEA
jgi:hypothetical protein